MSYASHLDAIKQLSKSLRADATLEEAEAWCGMYLRITSELKSRRRTTKDELAILERLRTGVSTAIKSIRAGDRFPNLDEAHIALSALQDSIERHTTGPDGYPLRR